MKLFRWIVMIRSDPAGFYATISPYKFLSGVDAGAGFRFPVFGSEPALYKGKFARFQVSELKRVGYNVFCLPWALYAAALWLKARKNRKW